MPHLPFLPYLTFSRLRVTFEALEPLVLTEYAGSALRSCLMETMLDKVCAKNRKKTCLEDCELRYTCAWSVLFNSYSFPEVSNYKKTPPPYILEPFSGERMQYNKAETFGFDFTLIGAGIKFLAIVQLAFQCMGEVGIGRGRGKFKFTGLEALNSDLEYKAISLYDQPEVLALTKLKIPNISNKLIIEQQIEFRTMIDEKINDETPSFQLFAKGLVRRLNLLANFHCGADWMNVDEIDFPENIVITNQTTRNEHHERKTRTMEKRMMLDGTVGQICYEGEGINDWMPLIVLGSWLHVGSSTSMGLGKYIIVE